MSKSRVSQVKSRSRHRSKLVNLAELVVRGYLTPAGWVLALVTVLSGGLAAGRDADFTQMPAIYVVASFLVGLFSTACVVAYVHKSRVFLRRRPIVPTTAGKDVVIEVEAENRSSKPAFEIEVMELGLPESITSTSEKDPAVIGRIEPGETARIEVHLRCEKRGSYTLKYLCGGSTYPFGICRGLLRSRQESTFLVYPKFELLDEFQVPEGRRYQPGGILVSSNVGESPEFMGTREYRTGDNLRHIHWSSWARLGKPVVKQFHEEYFVRLAVIVDTEVPASGSDDIFEAAVSKTAAIAEFLSRQEYLIDIFAVGTTVYHFQSGRAIAHFENILEILACLEPTPEVDWKTLWNELLAEAAKLTAIVVVLLTWDEQRAAFINQLKAVGVGVRVLLVSDQESVPIPVGLTAEEFIHLSPKPQTVE